MFHVLALALLAQAPSPAPSARPSPVPSPTASPIASIGGGLTIYAFHTGGTNRSGALDTKTGADLQNRADLSNLLLNLSAGVGKLRATATVGEYSLLTVGQAINPDTQAGANERLYSALPVAVLTYTFNSRWSVAAGKFAALLGQESPFAFENVNVQRGLGWSMEPTISRGVQLSYTNAPWTVTVQENDAYYSGHNRAFESLIAWSPNANTTMQLAAIIPGVDSPPNPTVSVGNKAEYDLMYTQQLGNCSCCHIFCGYARPYPSPSVTRRAKPPRPPFSWELIPSHPSSSSRCATRTYETSVPQTT